MRTGYLLKTTYGGGEYSNIFQCVPFNTTRLPVVLLHGSGAPYQYAEHARVHSARFGGYLAGTGRSSIAGTMAYQSWANDAVMTSIDNSIYYLKSQLGLPAGPVHIVGASMGGAVGLRYAALNPSKVASYTGLIPLTDLVAFYDSLPAGASKNEISSAWGVANGAALPAGADIANLASSLNGVVPSRLYYADNDTVVLPSWVTTVGASMGAELINVGALGHTDTAIGAALDAAVPNDLASFLDASES